MIKTQTTLKNQQGLGLLELLIAMLIGSFAMVYATQIVMSTYSSKRLLSAEAELQENARFGLSVINSIVQRAGGFGCKTSQQINTVSLLDFNEPSFTPWQAIEGWEAANSDYGEAYTTDADAPVLSAANGQWSSSGGAVIDKDISSVTHSDILKVWYTKGVSSALDSVNNGILNFTEMDLNQGDVVIVNDCKTVTFAQACSCETTDSPACNGQDTAADIAADSCNTPGNIAHTFNDLNIPTTEVSKLQQAIFFVSKPNAAASGVPTLYMARLGADAKPEAPEEVLSYVENLQVLFGEDTTGNNSPNYYVSGNAITDWQNVVSVKISLLLRSKNNFVLPESQTVTFNGAQLKMAKGDRHLRRVYSSTISLRNRNIGY